MSNELENESYEIEIDKKAADAFMKEHHLSIIFNDGKAEETLFYKTPPDWYCKFWRGEYEALKIYDDNKGHHLEIKHTDMENKKELSQAKYVSC